MNALIEYKAVYDYEKPVNFAPHIVRTFPRSDTATRYRRLHFETNAEADVQMRRDLFDNEFALCFYPAWESRELRFEARFEMEIREKNPFHFLVAAHAAELPFEYTAAERHALAPYLVMEPGERDLELPFWRRPAAPRPTAEIILELTKAIFENIEYERREDGEARTPAETVGLGRGACRDSCLLLAAMFRRLGLAARIVSGYLVDLEGAGGVEHVHRAEGAFHAWTETYVPGAGWIGCDGSNGVFCDHTFIAVAVGIAQSDIAPVTGRYYHRETVSSKLTAELTVREITAP